MIEVVLFLLLSCLIIGAGLYGIYKIMQQFEKVVDSATAFPVALILLLCFGFMCLNYGVFFPAEMNEYYIRVEAERIIQDRKRAEWKVADEWEKTVKELELQQVMQKLKEKKQHGS